MLKAARGLPHFAYNAQLSRQRKTSHPRARVGLCGLCSRAPKVTPKKARIAGMGGFSGVFCTLRGVSASGIAYFHVYDFNHGSRPTKALEPSDLDFFTSAPAVLLIGTGTMAASLPTLGEKGMRVVWGRGTTPFAKPSVSAT